MTMMTAAILNGDDRVYRVARRGVAVPRFHLLNGAIRRSGVVVDDDLVYPIELEDGRFTGVRRWDGFDGVNERPTNVFAFEVGVGRHVVVAFTDFGSNVNYEERLFLSGNRMKRHHVIKLDVVMPPCLCCATLRCADGFDFCTGCLNDEHLGKYYFPNCSGYQGFCGGHSIEDFSWGFRGEDRFDVSEVRGSHPFSLPDEVWHIIVGFMSPPSVSDAIVRSLRNEMNAGLGRDFEGWNDSLTKYLVVVENFDQVYTYWLRGRKHEPHPDFGINEYGHRLCWVVQSGCADGTDERGVLELHDINLRVRVNEEMVPSMVIDLTGDSDSDSDYEYVSS
jgi:hypothetical protein